jgi:hypothetical protein
LIIRGPRKTSASPILRDKKVFTTEAPVVRKNPFRQNQQLQVLNFVEAEFAILMIFEFFLMTAEDAEGAFLQIKISAYSVPLR